jgi:hypothetical protein
MLLLNFFPELESAWIEAGELKFGIIQQSKATLNSDLEFSKIHSRISLKISKKS